MMLQVINKSTANAAKTVQRFATASPAFQRATAQPPTSSLFTQAAIPTKSHSFQPPAFSNFALSGGNARDASIVTQPGWLIQNMRMSGAQGRVTM